MAVAWSVPAVVVAAAALRRAEYTCSRPPHPSSAPDSDQTVCDAVLGQGKFAKVYKVRSWLQGDKKCCLSGWLPALAAPADSAASWSEA